MPEYSVADIAEILNARLEGDGDRVIRGVAPAGVAGPEHLTFLERSTLAGRLEGTRPGALLVRDGVAMPSGGALLRVEHPEAAFAKAVALFHPDPPARPGVHPTALVGRGVRLGDGVSVGPYVVIEDDAVVGRGSRIESGVFLGAGVKLGADCRIRHAASILRGSVLGDRVVVYEGARVGAEGFGFAPTPSGALRMPQVGGCSVGDDVEIGANCTVDRGTLGNTTIGARTKLDNLVQVGHNVEIGTDCIIVAQVGIAGSTCVGNGVTIGGQVGISGHLTIGDGARIGAKSGVTRSVPAGATYSGDPARPHRVTLRARAAGLKAAETLTRLAELERRVDDIADVE